MNAIIRMKLTSLRSRIVSLTGLLIVALAIFGAVITHSGESTSSMKLFMPESYELTPGANVTLAGVRVGDVQSLRLVKGRDESRHDPVRTVEVTIRINRSDQIFIHPDSIATLKQEGLLGREYLDISRGFVGSPLSENSEIGFQAPRSIDFRKLFDAILSSNEKERSNANPDIH